MCDTRIFKSKNLDVAWSHKTGSFVRCDLNPTEGELSENYQALVILADNQGCPNHFILQVLKPLSW